MNQRVQVVKVNEAFEYNLNKLLSNGWEIYKMYVNKVILFKEFQDKKELAKFDASYF